MSYAHKSSQSIDRRPHGNRFPELHKQISWQRGRRQRQGERTWVCVVLYHTPCYWSAEILLRAHICKEFSNAICCNPKHLWITCHLNTAKVLSGGAPSFAFPPAWALDQRADGWKQPSHCKNDSTFSLYAAALCHRKETNQARSITLHLAERHPLTSAGNGCDAPDVSLFDFFSSLSSWGGSPIASKARWPYAASPQKGLTVMHLPPVGLPCIVLFQACSKRFCKLWMESSVDSGRAPFTQKRLRGFVIHNGSPTLLNYWF